VTGAETASPAAKIFLLALMSLSWCLLHFGQSHSLINRCSLSTMCLQFPQRFELGNHRSILTKLRPYQSHLYSNCLTSSPQLADARRLANAALSLIERASFLFLTIFFIDKSSTAINWFSRTSRVVNSLAI
jgi:hypothetical protein